ncbi:transposase family protein [Rhizobium sp. Root482]|uniref:transposase family protein n=1 Tax=Rhizobium sp. Root482 TaxID=1736543 RepID=UPI000AC388BC|nr:transposase family protein [Rhizobium sp. Root482]
MSTNFRPSDLVPAGFIAERITHIDDETCILLSRAGATASCPACGRMSRTVRSRYCRQVADLPLSGRRVRLLVRTRRFTCDAVLCGRQIFAERFGDVLPPYARRTGRLEHLVHHLALALGGRPAARFAQRLMLPVSNDTLLRVIRRRGLPPSIPPSVIGIDAKHLVACWPNPPKDIAAAAGITLRQLQWFTTERASLDGSARYDLTRLLGIEYDERMGGYTPKGPYVLIARKAQAIEAIYQEISGGGDACPCELVPAQGQADPSWRYVLINAHSTPPTIVMAPRGEAITERLSDLLMNYEGIQQVSPALYRDVVTTCARACQTPKANSREMTEFAKRYESHWTDCAWLPD